ncbi:MAG: 4Fe-4S dicluster domain-containing protein [Candidatus Brocadiia bacterium]
MAEPKFVSDENLVRFLGMVPGDRKFVNVRDEDGDGWAQLQAAEPAAVVQGLRGVRPFYSFKSLLLPASEVVAYYGGAEGDPLDEAERTGVAIIGARGCECRVLSYLDAIMLDEPDAEPFYEARRRNAFIVGVDCAVAADSCFCDLLGERAYPDANYDLNLSPVEDGFVVEAAAERGGAVLREASSLLTDADESQVAQRDAMRQKAADQLGEQNADFHLPDDYVEAMPETLEREFWRTELAECVQCGGCTAVCPACYCFLLYDQDSGEGYERARAWDSCQFTGYSEMAGPPGTTPPDPRREHMSKFQHRFAHKFWYNSIYPEILGCVGCGRCRDTCPGAIDLRRVLSEMHREYAKNG